MKEVLCAPVDARAIPEEWNLLVRVVLKEDLSHADQRSHVLVGVCHSLCELMERSRRGRRAVGAREVDANSQTNLPTIVQVLRERGLVDNVDLLEDDGAERLLVVVEQVELGRLHVDLVLKCFSSCLKLVEARYKLAHRLVRDRILVKAFEKNGRLVQVSTSESADGDLAGGPPPWLKAVVNHLALVKKVQLGACYAAADLEVAIGGGEGVHLLHRSSGECERHSVAASVHLLDASDRDRALLA